MYLLYHFDTYEPTLEECDTLEEVSQALNGKYYGEYYLYEGKGLHLEDTMDEYNKTYAERRKTVLAKLTPDERALLGL